MQTEEAIRAAISRLTLAQRARLADWLAGKMREGEEPPSVGEARAAYALSELHMTLEQYWAFEAASSQRHEFLNGALYAMSGASVAHNQITLRLAQALSRRLHGGPCQVFLSDLKLRLELGEDQIIYYPDVMVACQPQHWGHDFIADPRLVAEVLSPSTRHIDQREKSLSYQRSASIEEYLILSQRECCALVHRREQHWAAQRLDGADAALELHSLGVSLRLGEIYDGVRFAEPPPSAAQ